MRGAVDKEQPDMIIYLGDGIADAEEVEKKYPNIQMIKTLGNMDSKKEDEEWIKYAEICGKRFMMTHGHTFCSETAFAQSGVADARRIMHQSILSFMLENNIDITLHGHIHEPFIYNHGMGQSKHGWIFCPGRIGRVANYTGPVKPIYGVLKIKESGALEWQFVEADWA